MKQEDWKQAWLRKCFIVPSALQRQNKLSLLVSDCERVDVHEISASEAQAQQGSVLAEDSS
jgi:hypothetical protein